MHEAVDDVIQRRRIDPGGLGRIMSASIAIHVGTILLLLVVPRDWLIREQPRPVLMTISLGGSLGERTGGMVSASARQVEQVAPQPKRPQITPAATPPKRDVIAVPTKTPPKTPAKTEPGTPSTAVARPPTTGTKVTPGTAVAETGAAAQSTGLSLGGGPGGSALDPTFCCPEYAAELQRRIFVNWNRIQPETGTTLIVFEILKDGTFTAPKIEKTSGSVLLDLHAMNAFKGLKLQPLPKEYGEDRLKVHLSFQYVR